MTWEPVRREPPEVLGVDPGDHALLQVHVPLSVAPPAEWAAWFAAPPRVRLDPSLPVPTIVGSALVLAVADGQLEAAVRQLDVRLTVANQRFEDEVAPRLREQQPRDADAAGREERRLDAARSRARGL